MLFQFSRGLTIDVEENLFPCEGLDAGVINDLVTVLEKAFNSPTLGEVCRNTINKTNKVPKIVLD